jgi:hypothetical protein
MRKEVAQRFSCATQAGGGVAIVFVLVRGWAEMALPMRGIVILALVLLVYILYRYIFTDNVLGDTGWKKPKANSEMPKGSL